MGRDTRCDTHSNHSPQRVHDGITSRVVGEDGLVGEVKGSVHQETQKRTVHYCISHLVLRHGLYDVDKRYSCQRVESKSPLVLCVEFGILNSFNIIAVHFGCTFEPDHVNTEENDGKEYELFHVLCLLRYNVKNLQKLNKIVCYSKG